VNASIFAAETKRKTFPAQGEVDSLKMTYASVGDERQSMLRDDVSAFFELLKKYLASVEHD
jgi:hypothetical protein